eukprot:11277-Heterococcus_DN1.PRE.1
MAPMPHCATPSIATATVSAPQAGMDRMSQSKTTGPSDHLANKRFALQRVSALTGVDVLRTAKTRTDDGKECIVNSTECVLIRASMFRQLCLHDSATRLRAFSSAL